MLFLGNTWISRYPLNRYTRIQPDYAPLDSILATANARKVHADYEASIKQGKEQNSLDNYKYELYLKKCMKMIYGWKYLNPAVLMFMCSDKWIL